jgi:DNA ligase (NAD+)
VTNMVGIGEELIAKLYHAGLVTTPAHFYTLTEAVLLEHKKELEPMGETKARNVVAAISERRGQSLETFLVSLGIRGLGPSIAARLSGHFHTLEKVLSATPDQLNEVEGIAETLAETLRQGLHDRRGLIADLLKHIKLTENKPTEGPLTGKSFCLTGHVELDFGGKHYDARPDIEALIRAHGGAIKSVSKTLSHLVAGDEAGSKLEKAKKAGVSVIDGKALVNLLGGKS